MPALISTGATTTTTAGSCTEIDGLRKHACSREANSKDMSKKKGLLESGVNDFFWVSNTALCWNSFFTY